MTLTVTTSDIEKNFRLWRDRSLKEPVQITEQGRETAYLLSPETFQELWCSFRKAVSVSDLSDEEMVMILAAEVPSEHAYEVVDLEANGPSKI